MVMGTAGVTAALCVMALQQHGVVPGDGDILVTGAAGGVGSVAISLLASLGYSVAASTGRPAEAEYLQGLGAQRIVDRATLSAPGKPLQKEVWAGVIDTVGSHTLANACAATKSNGAVAACGLAQGADFPSTVMPFILRGVCLYGINSVFVPNAKRRDAWALLARHVSLDKMNAMAQEIGLSQAIEVAPQVLAGKTRGRVVVNVRE
jgi:acrylyl-CoA reductase (NADPH)